jgi:hypothetical protein
MTHNYAFLKILGFRAIRAFFQKNQSVLKPQDNKTLFRLFSSEKNIRRLQQYRLCFIVIGSMLIAFAG